MASGHLPGEVARTQGGSLDENGQRRRGRRSGYQEGQCKDPELSQRLLQPCLGGHVSGHVSGHSYGHLSLAGTILDRADLEWPAVHTGRPRAGPDEGRGAWRWADQCGEVSEGPWVSAAGSVPASSPGLCTSPRCRHATWLCPSQHVLLVWGELPGGQHLRGPRHHCLLLLGPQGDPEVGLPPTA